VRDVIFFYTSSDEWCWNLKYTPYDPAYLEYRERRAAA
jgi:hypothetical protein